MPAIVLIDSSILSVISVSTSSGAAPGEARDDGDGREVDLRVAVDAEARVADAADDDEGDDEDRREDGPADAEAGECLHGGLLTGRLAAEASDLEAVGEPAVGVDDDALAGGEAGADLDGVAVAVAERDDALRRRGRAPRTKTRETPESVTTAAAGTRSVGSVFGSSTRAVTKRPGFRSRSGFGTIASTTSVRASERSDGPM